MIRFGVSLSLCLLFANSLLADDAEAAKKLTDLGGKVVLNESGRATQVTFNKSSELGDAEYRLIGSLTELKTLTLYGQCKGLNDKTLPYLAGLTKLERLSTDGITVTDEGFRHFAALQSLKQLDFFHACFGMKGFTGAGFIHFKALPNLRSLTFAGMSVREEPFDALLEVTQLRELKNWHVQCGPGASERLAKMTNLTSLHFGQSLQRYDGKSRQLALTDATLRDIARMTALEKLELDEARLTYEGLKVLKSLPKLQTLTLRIIDIPAADIEKLKSDLPGVKVIWKPLTEEERKQLDRVEGLPEKPKK
jgi:hypothetical protein